MPDSRIKPRLTPLRRRVIDRELDALLDLEGTPRQRRLNALAGRAPRIHGILQRLVSASEHPTAFVQAAVERAGGRALSALDDADPPLPEGTRVDAWRLLEPVGAGGMG